MAALLLVACGGASPTGATAFPLPAETQARWPDCTLTGWKIETRPTPFQPPAGALCGAEPCTGLVRGHTDFDTRTITLWDADPSPDALLAWEACAACRWETTHTVRDVGCAA